MSVAIPPERLAQLGAPGASDRYLSTSFEYLGEPCFVLAKHKAGSRQAKGDRRIHAPRVRGVSARRTSVTLILVDDGRTMVYGRALVSG